MRVIVLGAGLVGGAMVKDLAEDANLKITAADIDRANLDRLKGQSDVRVIEADLSDSSVVSKLAEEHDLVVGALPGHMGFRALKTVIESGKNIVDIAFFPEDGFELDQLAKSKGVTAVIDCGIAPGCSNLILGYLTTVLDETDRFECYVGGLPRAREWPYEYKAAFSPSDVIEEYVRPARLVENGKVVTRPALSGVELLEFPGVGTLEAFNTDGLRSLIRTMSTGSEFGQIPHMKEKTMRYPGHAERMRMLRETGFFDKETVSLDGVGVRPRDLTSKLLFPMWKLNEGEEDFTVMRVLVEGTKAGKRERHVFDLLDSYDRTTNTTSMARTTGYTCTTVVRLLADGRFDRSGICPLEFVGQNPESYRYVMNGLGEKGIDFKETVKELS